MVNILPISAYSRPLSAIKSKKNTKTKVDGAKKTCKKLKQVAKVPKEQNEEKNNSKEISVDEPLKEKQSNNANPKDDMHKNKNEEKTTEEVNNSTLTKEDISTTTLKNATETSVRNSDKHTISEKENLKKEAVEVSKTTQKNTSTVENVTTVTLPTITQKANNTDVSTDIDNKHCLSNVREKNSETNKNTTDKIMLTDDKDKENKLPTILDTALCENVVDGGNARLELAEEFLAASPTAAFLMSFPLVSGNRADSPAEEHQNHIQVTAKDNSNQRRNEINSQPIHYFEKPNDTKQKSSTKINISSNNIISKQTEIHNKYIENNNNKQTNSKNSPIIPTTNMTNDNPFLNLSMSSLIPTTCALTDTTFGLDFDCNINKSIQSQPTSNFFYKSDPFSTVKSTIYSTSSISSGHEFNSFGLYPCAMEKYASKNKSDFPNVEENLMKIGSSRLTYDIDLGWSHKSLDFVNCTTTANTFNKDNILTTGTGPYSTSYNPFNPDFHVPLVTNSNKKDNNLSKPSSTFAETITSFYSQPTNLWSEDVPFYTNSNNIAKTLTAKHQNYIPLDHAQPNIKTNNQKTYETKHASNSGVDNLIKTSNVTVGQQLLTDKYTKKSPNKKHINWMTSEIRPIQNNCNPAHVEVKESHKPTYGLTQVPKKQDQNEANYFPISMHNFTTQATQEDLQVWPSARPVGTAEISIEPPPINLPTLVGDLALGPHDKKRNTELANRGISQSEIQNCSNFFSVTQLMNRSTDNAPSRYHAPNIEAPKSLQAKQNVTHSVNESNCKPMSRIESHLPQPCYSFNDTKSVNSYEIMGQFSQPKTKTNKSDKNPKGQKNSYSAESLIRGGTCNQKLQDNSNTKFIMPTQKYNDFNVPQNSVAQVSHFTPIIDYSDNSYTGQQISGTNSFYSNFMPGSSNLMSGNYTSGPFSGDFLDYNQSSECNYTNHKYEELKMRNNSTMFQQDKVPSNYKSPRRESAVKHKLDCSKKDSSKKYLSKRPKANTEIEEWSDATHMLWQNKTPTKRHSNLMPEEFAFPNYVSNQMPPTQYQPDFFNSHLMTSNMQSVGHNVDRSLTSFPATSRANFNLSTIFPEITMVSVIIITYSVTHIISA